MNSPSFYDTVIRNSKAFRSDDVCKDTSLLEPGTRAAVAALIADAKGMGKDVRLLETYRSQTRQSYLYTKHYTQLRVVGCHGYGVAADLGVFIDDKYQEDNKPYVFLKTLARMHGLISGQDWGHAKESGFVDSGHVQRVPVWRQGALFGGIWYPGVDYDPYKDSAANGHSDVTKEIPGAPKLPAPALPQVHQPSHPVAVHPAAEAHAMDPHPSLAHGIHSVWDGVSELWHTLKG